MTTPDAGLVLNAREGDADALAALFRLAYRLTGTRQDAEDVVHDVFVGLPEALARYEERGRLGAWLGRVTARVALMHQRRSRRRREIGLEDAAEIPGRAAANGDGAAVWAALDTLPATQRAVLVLKEMEGYSHAEIAATLGITQVTSRVRLLRALRQMRRQLEEDR